MRLNNFKELLLKKADDNPNLQLLIKYMRDDYLIEHTIESLEKMAAIYSKKNPNHAIMHFGTHMDADTEGDMFHDALSHHASHYKAALNSGNDKLADAHMKKIFETMHMADKLTRDGLSDHSGGKLKVEAIDPKPWERSGYSNKSQNGKFSTDTKGWGRNGGDYSWLRGAPHEAYDRETDVHGHKGAYPLNEIKVNGKYLHIEDVDSKNKYAEHPFDSHPIMSHYKDSPKLHTSDKHADYLKSSDAFHDVGGGMDSYWDKVESRGDSHYTRGQNKPDAIHKPLLRGDEAMAMLNQIKGKQGPAATPQPAKVISSDIKAEPTPVQEGKISGDEAMKRLNEIMGKK